jgi:hypothetical protein
MKRLESILQFSQNDTTPLPATKSDIQMCGNLKTVFDLSDPWPIPNFRRGGYLCITI